MPKYTEHGDPNEEEMDPREASIRFYTEKMGGGVSIDHVMVMMCAFDESINQPSLGSEKILEIVKDQLNKNRIRVAGLGGRAFHGNDG